MHIGEIVMTLGREGGRFAIAYDAEDGWVAALEWGREASDSPLAAAAAYGVGDTAEQAMDALDYNRAGPVNT